MFETTTTKHPKAFDSACERFATSHNLSMIARGTGIKEQVLRNKLNIEQPHKLTVEEMIAIYHATGDETLLDGALFECGLTAVKLPDADARPHLVARAVELNASVAGLGMHAVQVTSSGRITKGQRNTIVSVATAAMGELAILITEVENKFQTVPAVGCCIDAVRMMAGA
jgi:hypothetical protein